MSGEPKADSEGLDEAPPDLGVLRTAMAADRTLMAWIRTSFSMIGFGFTLYKILQAIQEAGRELPRETTPRNAGLVLIAMGVAALIIGNVEYWQTRRVLGKFQKFSMWQSPTWIMSALTAIGGLVLFYMVMMRIL